MIMHTQSLTLSVIVTKKIIKRNLGTKWTLLSCYQSEYMIDLCDMIVKSIVPLNLWLQLG